jgi:rsbT antagonist protein RsbS
MKIPGIHLTRIGSGDMLLEPTRGLDIGNGAETLENILVRLQREKSARLYYDLADLPVIDEVYYAWLESLGRACGAINVRMTCIHMQPTAAFGLASFLRDNPSFDTALDIESRFGA